MIYPFSSGLVTVNIGSGNGLLPDSTKPVPEPILTYHEWGFMVFTLEQFRSEVQGTVLYNKFEKYTFKNNYHISQGPMS